MKYGIHTSAAVLAFAFAALPATAQETAPDTLDTTISVLGEFEQQGLCALVERPDCRIPLNVIRLTYGPDGEFRGQMRFTTSFPANSQCPEMTVHSSFREVWGQVENEVEMRGSSSGIGEMRVYIYNPQKKTCRIQEKIFPLEAVLKATIDGDTGTGVLTVSMGHDRKDVAFTLDVKSARERMDQGICPADGTIGELNREDAQELSTVCGSQG